jgi:predicted phage tail protein
MFTDGTRLKKGTPTMTTVYLYGALGRKFTHRVRLEVSNPAEAVRALMANFPNFQKYMTEHSTPGYQMFIGPDPIAGPEQMNYPAGRQCIKIVPVIAGAAKSPVIGIIIGVVIIAAAIATAQFELLGAGVIAANATMFAGGIGAAMAINGVSQLLAGTPKAPTVSTTQNPNNVPSDIFNGPVNTVAQGLPVPIGYGRLRIGSAVISASINTVDQ